MKTYLAKHRIWIRRIEIKDRLSLNQKIFCLYEKSRRIRRLPVDYTHHHVFTFQSWGKHEHFRNSIVSGKLPSAVLSVCIHSLINMRVKVDTLHVSVTACSVQPHSWAFILRKVCHSGPVSPKIQNRNTHWNVIFSSLQWRLGVGYTACWKTSDLFTDNARQTWHPVECMLRVRRLSEAQVSLKEEWNPMLTVYTVYTVDYCQCWHSGTPKSNTPNSRVSAATCVKSST